MGNKIIVAHAGDAHKRQSKSKKRFIMFCFKKEWSACLGRTA